MLTRKQKINALLKLSKGDREGLSILGDRIPVPQIIVRRDGIDYDPKTDEVIIIDPNRPVIVLRIMENETGPKG